VTAECEAFAKRNRCEGVWGGRLRGRGGLFASRFCVSCGIAVRPVGARLADYPGTRMYTGGGQCQTCFRAAKNRGVAG